MVYPKITGPSTLIRSICFIGSLRFPQFRLYICAGRVTQRSFRRGDTYTSARKLAAAHSQGTFPVYVRQHSQVWSAGFTLPRIHRMTLGLWIGL